MFEQSKKRKEMKRSHSINGKQVKLACHEKAATISAEEKTRNPAPAPSASLEKGEKKKKARKVKRECIECQEDIEQEDIRNEDFAKCHSCENLICGECHAKETVFIREWLAVTLVCDECKKITCTQCIRLCTDCWNLPPSEKELAPAEDFGVFCKTCKPTEFIQVDCSYHDWWTCGKHQETPPYKCGECEANRNYCGRMGEF